MSRVTACVLFTSLLSCIPVSASEAADPSGEGAGRLVLGLDRIAREYREFQATPEAGEDTRFRSQSVPGMVGDWAFVDAVARAKDPSALIADLEVIGAEIVAVSGRNVSIRIPLAALDELAVLETLLSARPVLARRNVGAVTSQGDVAQRSDVARFDFGVDGAGSAVGVLSDSFDCLGGYAADVAGGDLPPDVVVIDDYDLDNCSDEGRAMAQIVHDVAPGARLLFHTAFKGEAAFAQGVRALARAGATVIVDDVGYFAAPMFQDGLVAQAVDEVVAQGVAYFSSSGNSGRNAYRSRFRDAGVIGSLGGMLHDFDPGPGVDTMLELDAHRAGTMILHWSEPYLSVSGAPGTRSDLDVCLWSAPVPSEEAVISCGDDANIAGPDGGSGDPVELAATFGEGRLWVSIERREGEAPRWVSLSPTFDADFVDAYEGVHAPTSYGHPNAAGANAVGASAYFMSPAFGLDRPLLNGFSSAGGIPILFDIDGRPIFELRRKPEFTAPDGANTTFFVEGRDIEPDGWPNFYGTSAAAPHAAGVAALMRARNPFLSPAAITALLQVTAVDILERSDGVAVDDARSFIGAGFDFDSGAGLIDALAAVAAVQPGWGWRRPFTSPWFLPRLR
ncbi:S8 family peptidase [Pseudazoarcus pumilus]|uniref:Peptidase S8 n=1 Tax=Pseudazoarcus pumilus TaxID=2067960 RepID=A0A2I6S5S8_9RHOO|nr:S8 family serine peptidase [Pseudazoarcus pumilus]AUN94617.1 peptidase S8 [Pseudazoarcus pumilus]